MTTRMITPSAARTVADRAYTTRFAGWAVGAADVIDPSLTVPLRPPTERAALDDPARVAAWIASWRDVGRGAEGDGGLAVDWEIRRWASMGSQQLPVRLRLSSPDAVARFARRGAHWQVATSRAALLGDVTGGLDAARRAVERVLPDVVGLADDDVARLAAVVGWLVAHPGCGLFVRQVPVRGVDTKWIERHRSVVTALVTAVTGADDIGVAVRPGLVRVRFCDPGLAPAGIRDLSAPVADLARLSCAPRHVLVVENLESLLALPELPGVVAVHGQGYAVRVLSKLDWVTGADVVYWGDLDTDGFNILAIARLGVPQVRSVLMDRATLAAHLDLAGPDPKPRRSFAGPLTAAELDALDALSEAGDLRLEQERIPWDVVLGVLARELGAACLPGESPTP